MFSAIDNWIISIFQWTVRQIELYTDTTRKDLICGHLNTNKVFFLFLLILSVAELFQKGLQLFTADIFFLMVFYSRNSEIEKISKRTSTINTLPKEIITRVPDRVLLVVLGFPAITMLLLIFLAVAMAFYHGISPKIETGLYVYLVVCAVVFSLFCLEYLLCTTSIPPGEKERRKVKKEMKAFTPEPIG